MAANTTPTAAWHAAMDRGVEARTNAASTMGATSIPTTSLSFPVTAPGSRPLPFSTWSLSNSSIAEARSSGWPSAPSALKDCGTPREPGEERSETMGPRYRAMSCSSNRFLGKNHGCCKSHRSRFFSTHHSCSASSHSPRMAATRAPRSCFSRSFRFITNG